MAARSGPGRLLERARGKLVQQLDINKVLPRLLRRGIFSVSEEKDILAPSTPQQRTSVLLDILAAKNDRKPFAEFCKTLEECSPHLLTLFLLDSQELSPESEEKPPPTQALQLGFELALKERDAVLRDNAKAQEELEQAVRQLEQMRQQRDQALDQLHTTRNRKPAKDKSSVISTPSGPPTTSPDGPGSIPSTTTTTTAPGPTKIHRTPSQKKMADKDKPPVPQSDQAYEELRFTKTTPSFNNNIYSSTSLIMNNSNRYGYNTWDQTNGANVVWETHQVTLRKAPTFGFGIAVSGGRDSPHFANGDPSVAISDVLTAGPAEGKLRINDRILSVNGLSLENVDHATAITVLRESGSTVSMVVKRRVLLPVATMGMGISNLPSKIILSKKSKKDEFGLVLGVRFFVKEIAPHSLAAHERAIREGDTVLKINNTPVEGLSLADARKILDKGKDKLQLLVCREEQPAAAAPPQQPLNNSQDFLPPPSAREDVNIYRPSVRSEEEVYAKDPTSMRQPVPRGAYPASQNTRYDGHYVLDNDLPHPRGPGVNAHVTDELDLYPARRIDTRDNFYSDWEDLTPRRDGMDRGDNYPPGGRPEGGYDEDVFASPHSIHERYVDMRSDIRLEPRRVTFAKDKQTGLGLRLAGGNATGIFIASVQAGSHAEREGLVEGDNILMANDREITGLTREEAVAYLTSLDGTVSMVVQYRKEDYDTIMTSHEAGDSFYIRTHFNHTATDSATEHSFRVGDIFLVKDTLFRGVGGSWLAVHVTDDVSENKKGTIPNSKTAEMLKSQQKEEEDKDPFPNRGKGSLFKRKSARRSKSLGKDHWEEVVFDVDDNAGLQTKFPAYERIVQQESGFVRPVVIFGGISDIARDRLLAEYPDRFEAPQLDKSADGKNKSAIIRLGAIRDAITNRKHCLLDVTPANVDRLNYAQYCPMVLYLKAESKQAVKDVRSRWKTSSKNLKKLQEYNDKLEKCYSHLFTGVIHHMGTDAWFPKLVEMIDNQQQQPVWMSEKSPAEDVNDEFMFPMSTRLSYAAGADSDFDLPRPKDDIDLNAGTKKPLLVRSSSDPSVNTHENIPGIPPYPSPPTYKNQRIPSHDSRLSGSETSPGFPPREDEFMHPEDRYYPSYYTDRAMESNYAASRAHIDPYATLTPSERLRPRAQQGGYDEFEPYRNRMGEGGDPSYPPNFSPDGRGGNAPYSHPTSSHQPANSSHFPGEQKNYADNSSHSSDSYSKYVNSPQNKHDDTKLREKFGTLPAMGSADRNKAHDPYRFTRSTANPINATVDKAKLSDLTAKYRNKQDGSTAPKPPPSKPVSSDSNPKVPPPLPVKKKEPPPVPVKNYSLKQRGVEPDELKMRNYENSNRSYNYADVNQSSVVASSAAATPPLPPPPSSSSLADYSGYHPPPMHSDHDRPYEYISVRQAQNNRNNDLSKDASLSTSSAQPFQQPQHFQGSSKDFNLNNQLPTSTSSSSSFVSYQYSQQQQQHQHQQQQQQQHHNMYSQHPGRPDMSGSNVGGAGLGGYNDNININNASSSFPDMLPPLPPTHNPYDSKAFANEVYMDQWDVNRTRSSHDLRDGEMGRVVDGAREDYMGEKGYRRPRTDDEQLQDLQYSRNRARSETRIPEMARRPHQWPGAYPDRYDSRGVTPGGGGTRGRLGRDPNRSHNPPQHSSASPDSRQYGSAFNAYRKPPSNTSTFSSHDPRSRVEVSRSGVNKRSGFSPGSELRKPVVISPKRPKDSSGLVYVIPPLPLPPPPPPPPPPLPPSPRSIPKVSFAKEKSQNQAAKNLRPAITTSSLKATPQGADSVAAMAVAAASANLVASKRTQAPSPPSSSPPPRPLQSPSPSASKSSPPPAVIIPSEAVNGPNQEASVDTGISPTHSGSDRGSSETPPTPDTVVCQSDSKSAGEVPEPNHTVIATAKGYFTSKGGLLESPETGVSIHIPEGAIEQGKEQEIYFKVCRDNNLLPPLDTEKGETLLSPLVMCGPHGVSFLKPVELRLPHSASANPESWSFALKSSDAPTGETTEWQNMTLAGSEGTAKGKVNQDSVSIQVDHF